jgi:hypothetical protein
MPLHVNVRDTAGGAGVGVLMVNGDKICTPSILSYQGIELLTRLNIFSCAARIRIL